MAGALHITQRGQGTMSRRRAAQVSRRSKAKRLGQNFESKLCASSVQW
ncbi:MAG: hypothetical protein U1E92_06010 [Moraxella osloensis]